MKPGIESGALKNAKPGALAIRFLFGGLVTVAAGLLAKQYGPAVGGVALAFPALLPAALTMVNDDEGRARAVEEARGARLGALALAGFAMTATWSLRAGLSPVVTLTLATAAWLVSAVVMWFVVHHRDTPGRREEAEGVAPGDAGYRRDAGTVPPQ
jgi:uncharacterized membrane protein (GlpM family)